LVHDDAVVGALVERDGRLEVAGRTEDDLCVHALEVADEGEVRELAEVAVVAQRRLRLRDLAARRLELTPQATVLGLDVTGARHAVPPVLDRLREAVDAVLHRREDVTHGVADPTADAAVAAPGVQGDEGDRGQDEQDQDRPSPIRPCRGHRSRSAPAPASGAFGRSGS